MNTDIEKLPVEEIKVITKHCKLPSIVFNYEETDLELMQAIEPINMNIRKHLEYTFSVRTILRGDRPDDQGIFANVIPQAIERLKHLPTSLNKIKKDIEKEFGKDKFGEEDKRKEWSKAIGWFCGYIAEIGAALHIPYFVNKFGADYKVYKWNKNSLSASPVTNILSIQAAGCGNGEIDLLFANQKNVYCFTSKLRHIYSGKLRWGEAEVKQMRIIESKNVKQFLDHKAIYGAIINDKNDFVNKCQQYEEVIVWDWHDLCKIWEQVYICFDQYDFDYKKINKIICDGQMNFAPYPHQEYAVAKAVKYFLSGGLSFLFDHICRSGKTLSALHLAVKTNAKNVLLLTSFPCINEMEWHTSIRKFRDFNRFNVIDVSSSASNLKKYKDGDYNFVMISMQDLKSRDGDGKDGDYGLDKEKFDDIRNVHWDLIIEDEVHEGFETEKSYEIKSKLRYSKSLALSGSPFVNYAVGTYSSLNSHHWSIMDEVKNSKKYPIYSKFPKMNFLLYNRPSELHNNIMQDYKAEEGLTYKKIFRIEDNKFYYENDIIREIKYIFGDFIEKKLSQRESPFGSRREKGEEIGKGVIIFVPEVKHAQLLCKLLKNMPTIVNLYGEAIDCTYADKYRGNDRSGQLQRWLANMTNNDRFIIIAVDQLTTGVTVSKIDTVILMNDSSAPQGLLQKMFRCRTAVEGKKNAYVIDMNPARTYDMIFDYTRYLADTTGQRQFAVFKEFFQCVPIYQGAELIDVDSKIKKIFAEAVERSNGFFRKKALILNLDKESKKLINELELLDSKSPGISESYEDGIGKGKTTKPNEPNESENESEEKEKKEETELNQLLNLLDNFTWLCIITEGKYNKWDEMLLAILEKSKRFPHVNRKQEFEQFIIKKGKSVDINKLIFLIKKVIDVVKLNTLIEDFNIRLKSDPKVITEFGNHLKENKFFKKMYGEVFTPMQLICSILNKLPKKVWKNPNLLWLDPACGTGNFLIEIKARLMDGLSKIIPDAKEREDHILTKMLHGSDIAPRNCVLACLRLDYDDKRKLNVVCTNSLIYDWGKKFDIIIGNPPYQGMSSASKTKTQSLWDQFVKLGFSLLKDNGYLALIHPSGWRSESKKIFTDAQILKEKQILYLEIHDEADGNKVFGATTRYDWYIVKNCPIKSETTIVDQNGVSTKVDLRKMSFIPSSMIDKVFSFLAKEGEDKVEIISNSAYHTQGKAKFFPSESKTIKQDKFIYPVVYSTPIESPTIWYSSTNENGHFGVPKVILNPCRPIGFVVDEKGEYGMSQFCVGIVGNDKYMKMVANIIQNQKTNGFAEFMESCHFTDKIFNKEVISLFRKNFWEEFA